MTADYSPLLTRGLAENKDVQIMLVDIDIDKFTQGYQLKFPLEVFKSDNDYKMAITVITVFSHDFDLDPELEVEDMKDICDKCSELQKNIFTVEIGDEGIEIDI